MRALMVAVLVGLVACDDGKDSGEEDVAVPAEGEWGAEEVGSTDTCNFSDADSGDGNDDGEPLVIAKTSDDTFTIVGGDGLDLSCTLSADLSFSCTTGEDTAVQDLNKTKGIDADITTVSTYEGAFSSAIEGSFSVNINLTCDGDGCAVLKKYEPDVSFPCDIGTELALSFSE